MKSYTETSNRYRNHTKLRSKVTNSVCIRLGQKMKILEFD